LRNLVNYLKIFLFTVIVFIFFITNSNSEIAFYKCPEQITEVNIGNDFFYKKGNIIGNNIVKLDKKNEKEIISIYLEFVNSNRDTLELIIEKKINKTTLGFDINYKKETNKTIRENYYNFIKVSDTYVFTKKEFWWSAKDNYKDEEKHDYESGGRCIKLKKNEYNNFLSKIGKNLINTKEKLKNKKSKKKINKKKFDGERTFAVFWSGYDELIIGKVLFIENNLVGRVEFDLPNDEASCFGTYVLSKNKGTWSFLCDNDKNASGFLKWNSSTGNISGTGNDMKGNEVKIKIAGEK